VVADIGWVRKFLTAPVKPGYRVAEAQLEVLVAIHDLIAELVEQGRPPRIAANSISYNPVNNDDGSDE